MQENSTYRIRAKVGDATENVINVKLDQHYDMFEILSLKINQENFYKTYESDYGVIVGRVIANGGFGVPNAKVSVFIESDGNDDIETRFYYPYKSPNSKNADGIRYNLLTDFLDKACYQNVGTFPNKRLVLDNDDVIDVFDKYYRYTTVTNNAGDYMIFGVPTGSQRLHVDVDLSDIGMLSQRPRDMIYKGYDINLFESPNKFRQDTNLNSLAQILTQDVGIYVYPYWGDTSDGADNIAVTRADIQLDYKFEPTCVFMGSIITDTGSNAIGKNCTSTEKLGKMSELIAGEGSIEMIRKTYDGKVEEFQVKGNRVIDGDGVWCYQIPMNLDYIMTDEFGNIAPSDNPEKGIPTRTRVRFRISLDDAPDDNTARKRCRYLVPNNPRLDEERFPQFTKSKEPDYEFGTRTREESFKDLLWNKVYTVKNYVPRLQKNRRVTDRKHTGIKLINHHEGNNPMPYNNVDIKLGFTYRLLCVIFKIFINLVQFLNQILTAISLAFCAIYKVFDRIANGLCKKFLGIRPFCFLAWPFRQLANLFKALIVPCVGISSDMCGGNTTHNNTFYPGCGNLMFSGKSAGGLASCIKDKTRESHNKKEDKKIKNGEIDESERTVALLGGTEELYNCVETALAEDNDTISLNFQNDWINGTLYAPMWFRKITKKRSYLFGIIKRRAKDQWCEGEKNYTRKILRVFAPCSPKRLGRVSYTNFDNKGVNAHYMNFSDNKRYADSCRDKCHESTKAINLDKGLIVKRQTMLGQDVYYYKPVEYGRPQDSLIENEKDFAVGEDGFDGGSVKILFATDIVLLGSLNDCDIHGVPQFFKSLESTTFQIPPNILFTDNEITVTMSKGSSNNASDDDPDNVNIEYDVTEESTSEMTGMDWGNFNKDICGKWSDPQDSGLFYSIGCSTIKMKPKSCINMSRICEFGVSLDETKSFLKSGVNVSSEDSPIDELLYGTIIPDGFISKDELYNDDERSLFATLNINGLCTDRNLENGLMEYTFKHVVVDNFDKSLYTYMLERQSKCALTQRYNYTLEEFSKGYYDFRMGKNPYFYDTEFRLPRYENSFYFFFGLNPGKTAIDKFNSQFTSDCANPNTQLDPIEIEAIGNSWCSEMEHNGDGYVAFNLSYIDLPCDIVITSSSDISFGEVSFTDNEDEKFYVSRRGYTIQELEDNGYIKKDFSIPYDVDDNGHIDTGEELTYFPNGVYDVVITDNNGEIIMTTFTMKADPLKSYVVGSDFTEPENILLKDLHTECAIAGDTKCLPANENEVTINTARAIGGTIAVSMPYNGRTGDPISSFSVEVKMLGEDPEVSTIIIYCNNTVKEQDSATSGSTCIKLLKKNSKVLLFGVPRGDQVYRITVTEMCCNSGCSDCKVSNNTYIEDVNIRKVENFKLFVNGTVDYDVIKHWKCGFDVDASGSGAPKVTKSSVNISDKWWHMSDQSNYLWFNLDAYNDIDKRLVQLIGFYNNGVKSINDAGYSGLYSSVMVSQYANKRASTLSLGSFLRKSNITIIDPNDNTYTWSPSRNSDWEDDYDAYGTIDDENPGLIRQENDRIDELLSTISESVGVGFTYKKKSDGTEIGWEAYNSLNAAERDEYVDSTTYDLFADLRTNGYVSDYADFETKLGNGSTCYIEDGDYMNIVPNNGGDMSEYDEVTFSEVLSMRKSDNDEENLSDNTKETIDGLFTVLSTINEEIIDLISEVDDIKNEFVGETKKAFQLSCPDDEKSIFFTTQTKHKPVVYHAVYKPESLEYNEADISFYTTECQYIYTDEGENVEMITIPTISYKSSDAFSPEKECEIDNGLDPTLCYAADNLTQCNTSCPGNKIQEFRKYCYFIAVRNRRGKRIPNDTLPKETEECPDRIPESLKLTQKYFGYHIIDKIFNKAIMAWSTVDNVPYFKPMKEGENCIDENKAGVSMCMSGLLTGKLYNGNVTKDIELGGQCSGLLESIFPVQTFGDYTLQIYTGVNNGETVDIVEDKMPTRRYIVGPDNVDHKCYDNFRVTNGQNGNQEDTDHSKLWNNCEKKQQYVPVLKTGMTLAIEDESDCQLLDTIDGRMKIVLSESSVNLSSTKLKNRRKGCKLNVKLQNTGNADNWLFLVFSAKNNGAIEYPLNLTERATEVFYRKDISMADFMAIWGDGSSFEPGDYYFDDGDETMITVDTFDEIGNEQIYIKIDEEKYNSLSDTTGYVKIDEGGCRAVKFDCKMEGDGKKLFMEDQRNLFSYYNNLEGFKLILNPFSRILGMYQKFGGKEVAGALSSKYVAEETETETTTYGFGNTGEFTFNDIDGYDDSYYVVAITDNNIRAISPVYDFPYVCAKLIFGIVYSKRETVDDDGMVNGYEYVETYKATFDIANVVIVKDKCDDSPISLPSGCVKPDEILYYFYYYPYDISFECKLDDNNTISGSYRHPAYKNNPFGYQMVTLDKPAYDSLYSIYKHSGQKVGSKIRNNTTIMAKDYVGLNHNVDWYGCKKSETASEYGCGLPYEYNIWVEIVWITNGGKWKREAEHCDEYYVDIECNCDESNDDCYYGTESDYVRIFKKGETYNPYNVGGLEKDDCPGGGFLGWSTSYDSFEVVAPSDITLEGKQSESMVYYAVWTCDFATVTWKDCDGNVLKEETIRKGIVLTKDDMPTSDTPSVAFMGWLVDGVEIDLTNGYEITGETVFVARCGSECKPIVDFYNCLDIMPYRISIVHMRLRVWESEESYTQGRDPIRSVDITWGPVHGIGSPNDPRTSNNAVYDTHPTAYPEGSYITMDITGVEIDGGNESGCYIYSDTGSDCPQGGEYCTFASGLCGSTDVIISGGLNVTSRCSDLVFKAVLTQNYEDCSCNTMYTVNWVKDCPTGDLYFTNYVCIGDYITLPQRNPTKDGEVFKEWDDGYNGEIIMSRVSSSTPNVGGVITICAVWEGESTATHTVEFYAGSTHLSLFDTTVNDGEKLELSDIPSDNEIVVPDGKTWDNKWTYKVDVGGGVYVGSDKYTRTEIHEDIAITVNTRFVAEFEDVVPTTTYTLSFYRSGTLMDSFEVDAGSTMTESGYEVPDPTVEGKTFIGWKTNGNDDDIRSSSTIAGMTVDNNYRFDAKYESMDVTVTFLWNLETTDTGGKDASGQVVQEPASVQTIPYGSAPTPPAQKPTLNGYTFGGWMIDGVTDEPMSDSDVAGTSVEDDVTYKAVWVDTHVRKYPIYWRILNYTNKSIQSIGVRLGVSYSGGNEDVVNTSLSAGGGISPYNPTTGTPGSHFHTDLTSDILPSTWDTLYGYDATMNYFYDGHTYTDYTITKAQGLLVSHSSRQSGSNYLPYIQSYVGTTTELVIELHDEPEPMPHTILFKVREVNGDFERNVQTITRTFVDSYTIVSSDIPSASQIISFANNGVSGKCTFLNDTTDTITWLDGNSPVNATISDDATYVAVVKYVTHTATFVWAKGDAPNINQTVVHGDYATAPETIDPSVVPVVEGWTFTGWDPEPSTTQVLNHMVFLAQWSEVVPDTVDVTFVAEEQNSSPVSSWVISTLRNVQIGHTLMQSEVPTEQDILDATPDSDAYEFVSWADGQSPAGATVTASSNVFKAYVKKKEYTVTFKVRDDDTGTVLGTISEKTVPYGYNLSASDLPNNSAILAATGNADAYDITSLYWKVGNATTDFEDGETVEVKSNKNVYAQLMRKLLHVNFDHNNGSGTVVPVSPLPFYGDTIEIIAAPTYSGYTFNGWKCSVNNQTYQPGSSYTVYSDATFTAQWVQDVPNTHTVRFVFGHGISDVVMTNVEHGSTVTPPSDPGIDGYQLNGWSGNPYQPITQDMTFTAIWKIRVIFKAEGSVIDTQYVSENGHVTIPNVTVGTGRRFKDKWVIENHSTQYANETVAGWSIQEPLVLVAVIVDVYTVEFYADSTKIGGTHTVESGNKVTPPDNSAINSAIAGTGKVLYELDGAFSGWRISNSDGTFNTYNQVYTNDWFTQNGITSNMKLFARLAYTVVFDFDQSGMTNVTQSIEQGHHASEPTPGAVENCTFTGWSSSVSGLDTDDNITANVTFTAQWDCQEPQVTHTVTWIKCDGTKLRDDHIAGDDFVYSSTSNPSLPTAVDVRTQGCLYTGKFTSNVLGKTVESPITCDITFEAVCSCADRTYTPTVYIVNNTGLTAAPIHIQSYTYELQGENSETLSTVTVNVDRNVTNGNSINVSPTVNNYVSFGIVKLKFNIQSDQYTINGNQGFDEETGTFTYEQKFSSNPDTGSTIPYMSFYDLQTNNRTMYVHIKRVSMFTTTNNGETPEESE